MDNVKRWVRPENRGEGYIFAPNKERAEKELGCEGCRKDDIDSDCLGPMEYINDEDGVAFVKRELAEVEAERDRYREAILNFVAADEGVETAYDEYVNKGTGVTEEDWEPVFRAEGVQEEALADLYEIAKQALEDSQ